MTFTSVTEFTSISRSFGSRVGLPIEQLGFAASWHARAEGRWAPAYDFKFEAEPLPFIACGTTSTPALAMCRVLKSSGFTASTSGKALISAIFQNSRAELEIAKGASGR